MILRTDFDVGDGGQHVVLLEGAEVSLRLPLPPGMQKTRLYASPGTASVCGH